MVATHGEDSLPVENVYHQKRLKSRLWRTDDTTKSHPLTYNTNDAVFIPKKMDFSLPTRRFCRQT